MSDQPRRESPLNQVTLADASPGSDTGVLMAEVPFQGLLNLRGRPDDAAFTEAVNKVLGTALPLEANSYVRSDNLTVCWLGPDEWLVMTSPDAEGPLAAKLREGLGETFSSVVDVTGYYTTLAVSGRNTRDFLAKGTTLDLHPSAFASGQCAQTHLAKANVLLWCVDDSPHIRVLVRRSFADYLATWLKEAAKEFGGIGPLAVVDETGEVVEGEAVQARG